MATTIPASLKSIDITRFAVRAAQVEKAKPVIAYWCNYWIVNQILARGLHTADDESTTYTMGLMDKLEQTKAEHSRDDAIVDDIAGQAYCEQFGLETFQRADNAVRANKATRQTADTFQAAATFLDLSHIWGPLDPEIASKIKFAKYHALRIAKALKAGEDPNLSNPIPEPPSEYQPSLDPNDPDVRALNGQNSLVKATTSLQPSIEEVPDEHDQLEPRLARASSLDQSLHPSRAPSLPRPSGPEYQLAPPEAPSPKELSAENFYHGPANDEVSPIAPSAAEGGISVGGGYFPSVPNEYDAAQHPELPGPPSNNPTYSPQVQAPPASSLPPPSPSNYTPREQASFSTVFPTHPGQSSGYVQTPTPSQNPQYPPHSSVPAFGNVYQTPQVPSIVPPPHRLPPQPIKYKESFRTDEDAVMMAQKHAKWAISALNFEDVNTAVKELRAALESLGAA